MNRRSFLKLLGIGATTAAVAPKILGEPTTSKDWMWKNEWGPLVTWQEPNSPADYSIGVDAGSGLGNSPSCVSVMRIGGIGEPDRQVAEFTSTIITPPDLTLIVAQIANKYRANCTDPRGPVLVIEQVRVYGDLVQNQLKIMGFARFFVTKKYRADKAPVEREGWYTTAFSAPILITQFVEAVKTGWYRPSSSNLKSITDKSVRELLNDGHVTSAAQSYVGYHSFDDFWRKG